MHDVNDLDNKLIKYILRRAANQMKTQKCKC